MQLNTTDMARSCLFTFSGVFGVIFKGNYKFQVCKQQHHYAFVHKFVPRRQQEQVAEDATFEHHNSHTDPDTRKIQIMRAGLTFVPEYGWNEKALALGAKSLGLSAAAHTLVDGGGPDLVHYFNISCNLKLEDHLKELSLANEKIDLGEFITDALEYRLKLIIPFVPKWPEAMALMAFPTQLPSHTRNMLDLINSIWYFYGDKSIDMAWYSKRFLLVIAYKASELSLIQDKSPEFSDTFDFLQRRVEKVVYAENMIHMMNENRRHLAEFSEGAFITARNLLGLNKWLR